MTGRFTNRIRDSPFSLKFRFSNFKETEEQLSGTEPTTKPATIGMIKPPILVEAPAGRILPP